MSNPPFPWRRTFILGFGFLGISIIWPIFNSFIPPMLENLGLAAGAIGFIMTWDNLFNLFLQPYVGSRSDRTVSRFGRRKPWLMVGAPIAAIFFITVPFVRDNFILIALAILGTNLGMALFRSPTVAYLGDLFKPGQRSQANGVINLMGGLGGAAALFAGGTLYKIGVPLPFIVGAGVMLLAIVIVLIGVKEPEIKTVSNTEETEPPGVLGNFREVWHNADKSGVFLLAAIFSWFVGWNAMEAFFTLYGINVLGIDAGDGAKMLTAFAAALIVFAIPSGLIATRIGRKPTIMIGLVGMVIGLSIGFLVRDQTTLLILLAVMGGFWALININSLPMVYDLGDEERIGALTGMYYFAASAAAITGPILAGTLIDLTGKNYAILWLFSAGFIALAAGLMLRVRSKKPATPA
jgi:maltose/moltooligosaccharide transporter